MLSTERFIRQSLELNLFFMRIMKEHLIFVETAFTPKNFDLAMQTRELRMQANRLLAETIEISNGFLGQDSLGSGEFVTEFTLNAEKATQYYTGIQIDTNLTRAELGLGSGMPLNNTPIMVQRVIALNQSAITITKAIAGLKTKLLNDVLGCRVFTHNYPLLIDHVRREAEFYLRMLNKLQAKDEIDTNREVAEQEAFWNRIMGEHALFIRGFLDPTEEVLFEVANRFGKEFSELTRESLAAHDQITLLPEVTRESLRATAEIRDFKRQGTEGLLGCKIKSIILPLLGDHTLREANHYLRLLRVFSGN